MVSKYACIFLEFCLAAVVSSSIVKRSYQNYPLEMCPQNAVCSDIYSLLSQGFGPTTYLVQFKCTCPTGSQCPAMPGAQTLATDVDKWYGLCQPVETLPRCQTGEVAEQLILESPELNSQSVVKVHCSCSGRELLDGGAATQWSDIPSDFKGGKYVKNLLCGGEDMMTKRGRFGSEGGRSRGKFYFYKK